MPKIYFYIPETQFTGNLPESVSEYWSWRISKSKDINILGKFDWTLQTYLRMIERGFPCELTTDPSKEGIVLSHQHFMADILHPSQNSLFVCFKGDNPANTFAQINIVQNPNDKGRSSVSKFAKNYFLPHWVQPDLCPRDNSRGEEFENVGYMGATQELAEELSSENWVQALKDKGFNWVERTDPETWTDYTDLDVLVAVRKFKSEADSFSNKPATKLYNAWAAGIPAVLGRESAYRSERKSAFDYIEVDTLGELMHSLEKLRGDINLRREMVNRGNKRKQEINNETTVKKWEAFLVNVAVPCYHAWQHSSQKEKDAYFLMCSVEKKKNSFVDMCSNIIKKVVHQVKKITKT